MRPAAGPRRLRLTLTLRSMPMDDASVHERKVARARLLAQPYEAKARSELWRELSRGGAHSLLQLAELRASVPAPPAVDPVEASPVVEMANPVASGEPVARQPDRGDRVSEQRPPSRLSPFSHPPTSPGGLGGRLPGVPRQPHLKKRVARGRYELC